MHIEELRDYCLSLPGASERFPFDDKTYVFFVAEKMFCATNIETFTYINVKCDPERAIELRERYPDVVPGFHMNKKHWNTILLTGIVLLLAAAAARIMMAARRVGLPLF